MSAALAFALALATPGAAGAGTVTAEPPCTMVPPRPASPVEQDRALKRLFEDAWDLVEIEMMAAATTFREGRGRVIRSYKGSVAPGAIIAVRAWPSSACGQGDARNGLRFRMFVAREAAHVHDPLPGEVFAALVRLKLVPPR